MRVSFRAPISPSIPFISPRKSGSSSIKNGEASRSGEMLLPVWRVEPVAAHVPARGRGVDEFPGADIDADVRALLAFLVEEQQVAAPQICQPHGTRNRSLLIRVVGKRQARLPKAELHQPAAIKSCRGRAAEVVGPSQHLQRVVCGVARHRFAYRRGRPGLRLRCARTSSKREWQDAGEKADRESIHGHIYTPNRTQLLSPLMRACAVLE